MIVERYYLCKTQEKINSQWRFIRVVLAKKGNDGCVLSKDKGALYGRQAPARPRASQNDTL